MVRRRGKEDIPAFVMEAAAHGSSGSCPLLPSTCTGCWGDPCPEPVTHTPQWPELFSSSNWGLFPPHHSTAWMTVAWPCCQHFPEHATLLFNKRAEVGGGREQSANCKTGHKTWTYIQVPRKKLRTTSFILTAPLSSKSP